MLEWVFPERILLETTFFSTIDSRIALPLDKFLLTKTHDTSVRSLTFVHFTVVLSKRVCHFYPHQVYTVETSCIFQFNVLCQAKCT